MAYPDSITPTYHILLTGMGLSYNVDGEVVGGIITSITVTEPDDVTAVASITGLNIDAAALYLAILTDDTATIDGLILEPDSINYAGNTGNDEFVGGNFADILDGGAGADTLSGGVGNALVDGKDTVTYANSGNPVTVDLFFGTGSGGDAAGNSYSNIENVIGSAGDDTLIGSQFDNVLTGGAGADSLSGMDGVDTASYAGSDAAVTVSLAAGVAGVGGYAQGDSLIGVENVIGSDFADVLTGDDEDNVIEGGKAADTLAGGGGNDTVSYQSSAAAVTLTLGAAGAQALGTGAGSDALGDKVSGFVNTIGGLGADVLTGNELANRLDGGAGNDVLKGNAGDDVLVGGAGADTLDGGLGNDVLIGDAGADTLTGGDGTGDTANYVDAFGGVTVGLGVNGAVAVANGDIAEGDKLASIENSHW